jgi:RimJ/RimL family protein N-acetyltransferase
MENYGSINEHFYLSKIQESDAKYLIKYHNDYRIFSYINGLPNPYKETDANEYIKRVNENKNKDYIDYAIRCKKTNLLIGDITIYIWNKKFRKDNEIDEEIWSLGYWLDPELHNKNIMTNVINFVLNKIVIDKKWFRVNIFVGNWPSRKILEKNGFKCIEERYNMFEKDSKKINGWILELIR